MASRRSFGKTWWGNAWIEAMERIDYNTNRLPRGRRYAAAGMVWEIKVENGEVLARVKGSRPTPYKVKINLKKFDQKQIETIKAVIAENPVLASELSLGKLPEEMLALLDARKIRLLPASWKDLAASCSCPDWANPCKHLAAVYYLLANEIDKNPFIIFELRGVSAGELMDAAGFSAGETKRDAFIPYTEVTVPAGEQVHAVTLDLAFENAGKEALSVLLTGSPLFYPAGDFKKYLLRAYQNVTRAVEELTLSEDSISFENVNFCLLYPANACFTLSDVNFFVFPGGGRVDFLRGEKSSKRIPEAINGRLALKKRAGEITGADRLLELFVKLPLNPSLEGNSPPARFLNVAVAVAQALAREAAYLPEVVSDPDGNFSVRYIPLVNSEKINEAIECLVKIMPAGFVFREKDKAVLAGREAVLEVLSLALSYLVRRFSGIEQEDKLCNTFFKGARYAADRFEEKQTAKAAADWLARLHAQAGDISPVIKIELPEKGDKFKLQVEVENKNDPLTPPLPLARIFGRAGEIFSRPAEEVRSEVARQITLAAEYLPGLKDVLNSKGRKPLLIEPLEMADFLSRGQEILNFLGISVVVPKELKRLATARVAIKAAYNGSPVSYLSLEKVLNFSWEVALGETTLTKEEFIALAGSATGLVRFKDQYLLLKPEEVKSILQQLNKPLPRPSSMELLRASLTGELQETVFNPDEALKKVLDGLSRIERPAVPEGLANLRPYQKRGYQWLYTNTVRGLGCCLADDMGLGKTVQVLALILKLKEEHRLESPALVICPTTLVGNWMKECVRFAPSLSVAVYHGAERRLYTSGTDIVITTYGVLRRDLGKFKSKEWSLAVIDEAQNIKNPNSEQTKAVKSLPAKVRLALSGTPVENRLTELWSIFDFINQGYFGSLAEFTRRFAVPIEKYRDQDRINRLKKAAAPFILRRLKTDRSIIKDLPDKLITNEYCRLTKEQAAIYQQVVDTAMREIQESEGIKRKGLIFKLITSLKQICNHPAHYTKKGSAAKELSGKAEKTVELIEKIILAKEKVLVFTQYREMGELLTEMISRELKEDVLFFHGGLPRTKRDKLVEDFQTGGRHPVLIVSLKAGGTGLNLTAATNVIHYDLWWNPAVEAQATDRTYRIGQSRKVIVYRLITLGTFEEKIDEMLKLKKELAEMTVSAGEQWLTELSDRELLEIFRMAGNNHHRLRQ
jgi:uncharacterized Zn finger protein/superfamily II DNA or RNA helicase